MSTRHKNEGNKLTIATVIIESSIFIGHEVPLGKGSIILSYFSSYLLSFLFCFQPFSPTGDPLPVITPATTPPAPTRKSSSQSTLQPTTAKSFPEKPENVAAQALSDTEIELTWSPPGVPHGKILEYVCIYFKAGEYFE